MASDESANGEVSVDLSEDVRDWLDDQAAGNGESAADVANRLLAAHYELDQGERPPADLPAADDRSGVSEADLEERLDAFDAEFRELIEDVRKRVVQLKRETDRKAPADHDHDDLRDRLDDLADAVDEAESRLDAGFENYEEILEFLTDETDRLRDRTDTLARAVVELRSELESLAADRARREGVRELKRAAGQLGVRTAECADCESSIDVAMLTAPECPHCASRFTDVRPGTRFLKPDVLETGSPPALAEGEDAALDADLEEIVDDGDRDRDVPDGLEWASVGDGGDR